MRKLKVGIIGCGRISVVYKDAFKICSDLIEFKFAVDKVIERAQSFAEDFDCGFSNVFEDIFDNRIY